MANSHNGNQKPMGGGLLVLFIGSNIPKQVVKDLEKLKDNNREVEL